MLALVAAEAIERAIAAFNRSEVTNAGGRFDIERVAAVRIGQWHPEIELVWLRMVLRVRVPWADGEVARQEDAEDGHRLVDERRPSLAAVVVV